MIKNIIKIALLQLLASKNDQEANLKKGDLYCRKAKGLGADIVLFPEMWNIGYTPFNQDIFHQDYTPQHAVTYAEDIKKWQSQAISLDSPFIQHFRKLAKELNIAIAITYLEKHKNDPRNSVSLIDRKGNIQFTYAKVHTCDFSAEAVCAPGDDFFVCDLDTEKGVVKMGAMICFDREFPESARVLMLKGAEIILTPNACEMEENRIGQFKSRAYENMVGVALANYASPQNNGHSCAFDGIAFNEDGSSRDTGILMASEEENVFIAEFDIEKIREFRKKEVWGNAYRKPKQYQSLVSLEVNEPFVRDNARK
ncbi:MAG: carbon-nitrogen hydrolase family protein [Gammaproteobacteria bacterium]|nr:carbon-nitrogen hydrolase family protein [Gammaproteobacteria bacterium]